MITATIQQFVKILAGNIAAGIPTLVFSQPGIGKTSICEAMGNAYASRFTGGVFVISTTEYNPLDVGGLYQVKDGLTVRCPSSQIPLDKPVLILIDEFGDCPQYEQSGWYRLLNNQTLGENKLCEDSYVCAASNRPEDNAASREVSSAAKGRCCCVTLRADAKSVVSFAVKCKWDSRIIGFINAYPDSIDNGFDVGDPYCGATPRDFERVNKLESIDAISSVFEIAELQIVGNIGHNWGPKYLAFRSLSLPAVNLVFDNPKTAPLLEEKDKQFAYNSAIVGATTNENFSKAVDYALRLDRVAGFSLCYDLKTKLGKTLTSSASAVKIATVYSELFN